MVEESTGICSDGAVRVRCRGIIALILAFTCPAGSAALYLNLLVELQPCSAAIAELVVVPPYSLYLGSSVWLFDSSHNSLEHILPFPSQGRDNQEMNVFIRLADVDAESPGMGIVHGQ